MAANNDQPYLGQVSFFLAFFFFFLLFLNGSFCKFLCRAVIKYKRWKRRKKDKRGVRDE